MFRFFREFGATDAALATHALVDGMSLAYNTVTLPLANIDSRPALTPRIKFCLSICTGAAESRNIATSLKIGNGRLRVAGVNM
jgi:hypothetical protein